MFILRRKEEGGKNRVKLAKNWLNDYQKKKKKVKWALKG